METLVQLAVLVSLPIYFGIRHYCEYESFDSAKWGLPEKLAALFFILYIGFFLLVGREHLYSLQEFGADNRKFGSFFVFPSIAFAVALFPKIAAEYSEHYAGLAATGMQRIVGIFGWAYLLVLFLTLVC
ncbi:hypothetical protein [Rheinheimera nanhaiensis]|uniref:hypothetical protein n=1 Tax=Rheinheimera nanhaiensis TaxID=1163621 RepID=UPI00058B8BAF|nr:hypothetical protein [Rheinheimera nanhaiensis]